jgi:hypothetical protein
MTFRRHSAAEISVFTWRKNWEFAAPCLVRNKKFYSKYFLFGVEHVLFERKRAKKSQFLRSCKNWECYNKYYAIWCELFSHRARPELCAKFTPDRVILSWFNRLLQPLARCEKCCPKMGNGNDTSFLIWNAHSNVGKTNPFNFLCLSFIKLHQTPRLKALLHGITITTTRSGKEGNLNENEPHK